MNVFNPENSEHHIRIIPRQYVETGKMTIRHELTGAISEIILTCATVSGYLTAPFSFEFVEGGSYEIELTDTEENMLYRGKAYATAKEHLRNYHLTT